MENLAIITFKDSQHATDGLNRLQELNQLGDITIYNFALILKTGDEQFRLLQQDGPDTGGQPAAGAIGGMLIGAIGGPIGMTIGMLTGVMVGSANEADSMDFSQHVLDEVNHKIGVGTFAIILDVEEDNEGFINGYMEPYDGIVVRTDIAGQYEVYDNEQWEELNKEIDVEQEALKGAIDKDKASIKAKIDKLKKERDAILEKAKERSAKRKKYLEDRIKEIDAKMAAAGEKAKDKLKAHRQKLKDKLTHIKSQWDQAFV